MFGENVRPGQVWWRAKDGKRVDVAILATHHEEGTLLIKEEGKRKSLTIEQFFFDYKPFRQYKFRNYSMARSPEGWCVAGGFANSGGIQEWCYDEEDAVVRMEAMNKDPRSFELSVEKDDVTA